MTGRKDFNRNGSAMRPFLERTRQEDLNHWITA
jgi:hypothetical protein